MVAALLTNNRFSRGLKAKTELRQDILKIIKDSRQQRSAEKADSSVFQYNLEARRQIMGTVGARLSWKVLRIEP